MDSTSYNIFWKGFPSQDKINVELPSYFSNHNYIKIKVKEIYTVFNGYHELFLTCDGINYDRTYNLTEEAEYNYAVNLNRFLEGGCKNPSFIIPYKKNINFNLICTMNRNIIQSLSKVYLNIEFESVD